MFANSLSLTTPHQAPSICQDESFVKRSPRWRNPFCSFTRPQQLRLFSPSFFGILSIRGFFIRQMGIGGENIFSPTNEGEPTRANPENHSLPLVRSPGRRGGPFLYLDLSKLEDWQGGPLRRGGARAGRLGPDRGVSAGRAD